MNDFKINISITNKSNINNVDFDNIKFGTINTDHMFMCEFKDGKWQDGQILPFGKIPLSPGTSALHYGQSIFEGMRAQKSENGEEIILFRPEENHKRMNISAHRMCMPQIPEEIFMKGLETLLSIDHEWIPTKIGSGLYMRPFYFASDDFLGVKQSDNYIFMIYCCPVNAYYSSALSVYVEQKYSRSAKKGGVGFAKCAGNYAASMYPAKLAKDKGFDQVMWTDAENHEYIEETGTTNIFALIGDTVVTPSLSESILPGITRASILTYLQSKGIKTEERNLSITELANAQHNGTLKEMWAAGTAATVVHIKSFNYKDKDYAIATPEDGLKEQILTDFRDIKRGLVEDTFNWTKRIVPATYASEA